MGYPVACILPTEVSKMFWLGMIILLLPSYAADTYESALRAADIAVVVLSQGDSYNSRLARELRSNINFQASTLGQQGPKVYLTHEDMPYDTAWMIFPVLKTLYKAHGDNISWIFFCEERTRIDLEKLLTFLSQFTHTLDIWIGHGVANHVNSFLRRYDPEIPHSLLAAGFVISGAVLKRLASLKPLENIEGDMVIRASSYTFSDIVGTPLISVPSLFCEEKRVECITYPKPFVPFIKPVPKEDIYFAVRTYHMHHNVRVPVVQKTWALDATLIEFFSDVQNDTIPTTSLGFNTYYGHCAKTFKIMQLVLERARRLPGLQWLVIADDDTLLSVPRLRSLLGWWSGEPVVLGERYGYRFASPKRWINFPVLGAGVVISIKLLSTVVENCNCTEPTDYDDLVLGDCLNHLRMNLVHSPFFHQERPLDYPPALLATQAPVSFHHMDWMADPVSEYHRWLVSDTDGV